MIGFIKYYRKIQNNLIWLSDEPYCRRSAWDYLIVNARFDDGTEIRNNIVTSVKRGQFLTSIRELSDEWKWSKNKVTRFLTLLEVEDMITKKELKNGTLLTIVNYDVYQDRWDADETPTRHERDANETLTRRERDTIKEDNNINNINNIKEDEEDDIMPVFPVDDIPKPKNNDPHKEERERIIEYLNIKCGTRYRPNSKTTIEYVNGRFNDGFSEADFYTVIDKKSAEWIGTKLEQYLAPTTLFAVSKFEKYLNQKIVGESNHYMPSNRNEQFNKLMEQIRRDEGGY